MTEMTHSVLCTLLYLLVAVVVTEAIDCSLVRCRRPLCANPVTPPGACCPSCEDSNCKFEGCVNFLEGGRPQWRPNPCRICLCDNERNEQFCAIIDCAFLTEDDCFGHPVVTKPGECCPSCDFGTPKTGCHVVPQLFSKRNITVSQSVGFRSSCTKEINKHTCDKIGFRARGKKFQCKPVTGRKVVRFRQKYCPLAWGVSRDVVRCRAVEDKTISVGCDLKL